MYDAVRTIQSDAVLRRPGSRVLRTYGEAACTENVVLFRHAVTVDGRIVDQFAGSLRDACIGSRGSP